METENRRETRLIRCTARRSDLDLHCETQRLTVALRDAATLARSRCTARRSDFGSFPWVGSNGLETENRRETRLIRCTARRSGFSIAVPKAERIVLKRTENLGEAPKIRCTARRSDCSFSHDLPTQIALPRRSCSPRGEFINYSIRQELARAQIRRGERQPILVD